MHTNSNRQIPTKEKNNYNDETMQFSPLVIFSIIGGGHSVVAQHYNFIIMQPDDMEWHEEWGSPAHFDTSDSSSIILKPATSLIPNIEQLRTEGLQMNNAYVASPLCGTSRYSTMTGRYASRSSYGREQHFNSVTRNVKIANTKLEDITTVADGNDCTENNLAAAFSDGGYTTAMIGKWHLTSSALLEDMNGNYSYSEAQAEITKCGFEFAEAIYPENLNEKWHDTTIDHNMEHLTARAIEFIDHAVNSGSSPQPFFMYFNPTAPHAGGNVRTVLETFDCRNTVEGYVNLNLPYGEYTKYSNDVDCSDYRQSVVTRGDSGGVPATDKELGMIWVDDSVGAILEALEDFGQLHNTFFLFMMDHGTEGKNTLYEPGIRIPQFIHFPAEFGTNGLEFDGLVSTIDIGPTVLDYAGLLTSNGNTPYPMDGKS